MEYRPFGKKIECSYEGCGKTFTKKASLLRHVKDQHGESVNKSCRSHYACPVDGCDALLYRADLLIHHLQAVHAVDAGVINKKFSSWEQFLSWKAQVEEETHTAYVTKSGARKSKCPSTPYGSVSDHCKEVKTYHFVCYRDGPQKTLPETTQRKRKRSGSRKLNAACCSQIKAVHHADDSVDVRFAQTHINHSPGPHENDILPLPKSVKEDVKSKLLSGWSRKKVFQEAKSAVSACPGVLRRHLLTMQDIRNLERAAVSPGLKTEPSVTEDLPLSELLADEGPEKPDMVASIFSLCSSIRSAVETNRMSQERLEQVSVLLEEAQVELQCGGGVQSDTEMDGASTNESLNSRKRKADQDISETETRQTQLTPMSGELNSSGEMNLLADHTYASGCDLLS